MSVKIHPIALLFLAQFLVVQVAEAGLIRNSGRGSQSGQVETDYFFIQSKDIIRFSDSSIGMSEAAYDARFNFTNTISGGGRGISAVPTSGPQETNCNGSYNQDQEDSLQDEVDFWASSSDPSAPTELANAEAALEALIVGSPCVWEFELGENLLTFGSFNMFFDTPLVNHQVVWEIVGDTNENLTGAINEGGDIVTPSGIISNGQVMLNAAAPASLAVGDYDIRVSATLSSAFGEFFFEQKNLGSGSSVEEIRLELFNEINPDWVLWADGGMVDPEPEEYIKGYRSVNRSDEVRTADMFFESISESLHIVASSSEPAPNPVTAPSALLLMPFGFVLIWLRKRQYHS